MKNDYFLTKAVASNLSFASLTALTVFLGITKQTEAAVINFDANTYAFSNPNTCTPKLAPGNKCFVENGVNVEAFSSRETGSEPGHFHEGGHFHARNSYEAQHFSTTEGLLGIYLTLKNDRPFSLISLDYQLRDNDDAIAGYTTDDTKILISTEFDPTLPVPGQFMEVSIGNTLGLPFQTLELLDFEKVTQVYITSSGDVNFDNITLNTIPEPSTILGLLTLGTMGLVSRFRGNKESH